MAPENCWTSSQNPTLSPPIKLVCDIPYPSSEKQKPKPQWVRSVVKGNSVMPIPNEKYSCDCNPYTELDKTRQTKPLRPGRKMSCQHTQGNTKTHQPENAKRHEDDAKSQECRKQCQSCVGIFHACSEVQLLIYDLLCTNARTHDFCKSSGTMWLQKHTFAFLSRIFNTLYKQFLK